jgi:hypothetical protein
MPTPSSIPKSSSMAVFILPNFVQLRLMADLFKQDLKLDSSAKRSKFSKSSTGSMIATTKAVKRMKNADTSYKASFFACLIHNFPCFVRIRNRKEVEKLKEMEK